MALPSAFEQELLELMNRARANPAGEFDRLILDASTNTAVDGSVTSAINYFNVDLALFQSQLQGYGAVAPLAWSNPLNEAAYAHSYQMIIQDSQAHVLPGEMDIGDRIRAAGYDFSGFGSYGYGENIYAFAKSPIHAHAGFYIDWGYGTGGMQTPPGHRDSMLNGNFTEIGISAIPESNSATSVGPYVVTEEFAYRPSYAPQILGSVFNDADNDGYYDAGEGLSGVNISIAGSGGYYTTTSWDAGGYQLAVPEGYYTVTFSGGGLGSAISKQVSISTDNVQVNAVAGSAGTTLATSGNDVFISTIQSQVIDGLGGTDTLVLFSSRANATVVFSGEHATVYSAADGTDTLTSIERLEFTDGTLALDLSGDAGQVYRLYQAAFGRTPDTVGLSSNVGLVDNGMSLHDMANAFAISPEFQSQFGANTTDAEYVNALYYNVLGRGPDQAGLYGWLDALANGWDRGHVLTGFSESPENIALVAPAIDDGIWLV